MNKRKDRLTEFFTSKWFGVVLGIVCFFAIGFMFGRLSQGPQLPNILKGGNPKDLTLLWDVWDTLKNQYVDEGKVVDDEMYYGAIKGLVNSVGDSATIFLDPKETEEFNKSVEGKAFEGIGAELAYENGRIVVVAPLKGSPAIKAGIKPGDIIFKVDDKEITSNETIFDVVAKIRGEAGTKVKLNVLHKGELRPVDIEIVRGEIDVPSMELKSSDNLEGVSILRISRFTDESVSVWKANWDKNIKAIAASKAKGLIIDLRGNPGGYFDSAIYAGEDFLPKGTIMAKQTNRSGDEEIFRVDRDGRLLNIPIVVLVDDGSASASEILAGMLQQNKRATVVGENTYGKGTAQTIVNYGDGSTLHITILKWLLPDGNWLNRENPIKPDVVQDYPEDEYKKGNDVQLKKAEELIKSKI